MAKNMIRRPFPRGGIRTRLPVTIYRRSSDEFSPTEIEGLALWLDASSSDLYTTDAGPVVAVNDPRDIGSLAVWLDASDSATLFQDASATTAASAASDPIGCWKDKSGNNRHYTGSSTTRPLLAIAKHNGKNSVYFDGSDDVLETVGQSNSSVMDATGACAWVVYEPNNDTDYAVLGFSASAAGYESYSGGGCYHAYFRTDRFPALTPLPPASGLTLLTSSASVASDLQSLRINGATTITHPCATTFATWRALGSQAWRVGRDTGILNGWVSEVIVLGRSATAAEVAQVEKYLAAKWGISGVHAPATASSDPVGYWADKSGNNRHAVQATAGSRPVVGTQNGRKALTFDGTNDHFVLGDLSAAFPTAAEIIASYGITSIDTAYVIYQTGNNSTSDAFGAQTYSGAFRGARLNGVALSGLPTTSGAYLWGAASSSSSHDLFLQGAKVLSSAADYAAGSNHAIGTRTEDGTATTSLLGRINEVCVFNRVLTSSERQRVNRYLATRWGITLAPTVANADAQDWINRVYANGGSVSSATAQAVSVFCESIASAGIRDRFYRVNLFAGNSDASLNAVRTPLFLGPSLGGTQYGGTTDTNNNFLAADYNEASGLQGNGSTKYLNTGVPMNFANLRDYHMSAYVASVTGNAGFIGADTDGDGVSPRGFQSLASFASATRVWVWYNIGTTFRESTNSSNSYTPGLLTGVGSAAANNLYVGSSSVASVGAGTNETISRTFPVYVFAHNGRNASVLTYANARLGGYSLGLTMTATQVGQYNTALAAFNAALGRA